MLASLVASLHYLTLALGLTAIFVRARTLRATPLDLKRLFAADNAWGIAAILWIATGLARAFAGLEKGTDFYVHSTLFWVKLGLFATVFALEMTPMITLIRWRMIVGKGGTPDTSNARTLARLSHLELVVTVLIVFVASAMARGLDR